MYVHITEADELRKLFERDAEEIGHISVREVLSRSKYQALGRRDFTRADLNAFMPDEPYGSSAIARDFEDRDPDASPDEDDDEDGRSKAREKRNLIIASLEFVRTTVASALGKRRSATFQVQAWRPKGVSVCFAFRVTGRHNDLDADDADDGPADKADTPLSDAPTIAASTPRTLPDPMELPETVVAHIESAYRKLFDSVERGHQVTQVMTQDAMHDLMASHQHAARQLIGANGELRKQITQLNTELERREGVIAELQSTLLSVKVDTAALALDREVRADPAELKLRQEIATSVIDNIGALGRMALASKLGLDPALIGLLDAVTKDEKLMERLRMPEVSQMFGEPGATDALGQFLDLALEQYRAQQAAKKATNSTAA